MFGYLDLLGPKSLIIRYLDPLGNTKSLHTLYDPWGTSIPAGTAKATLLVKPSRSRPG